MIRGTAVKISTTISADDAITSVSLSITDPDGTEVVSGEAMILVSGTTYKYIYQSATGNTAGRYTATISAVSGAYTAMAQGSFNLE